ncbi:hypothetical protein [Ascidiimonas sp. W6]|uniref:hypothetical protein n=1 Tax=Ascidiimonas meishanensis TaxID=3128903 RepID=UPI0030ED23F3
MNKKIINALELSKKLALAGLFSSMLVLNSCFSDNGEPRIKEYDEKTVYESTKGIITEVEEIEPGNDYRVLDEKIIDDKSKSIAIVHALDGSIDTLSIAKIESDKQESNRHHSALRPILYYTLASSLFRNNLGSVAPNSKYYKTQSAFNKSTGLKNDLQSTATRRTVRTPKASSSGYGKGKSFRSFGG